MTRPILDPTGRQLNGTTVQLNPTTQLFWPLCFACLPALIQAHPEFTPEQAAHESYEYANALMQRIGFAATNPENPA